MECIRGRSLQDHRPGPTMRSGGNESISMAVANGLAAVHELDWSIAMSNRPTSWSRMEQERSSSRISVCVMDELGRTGKSPGRHRTTRSRRVARLIIAIWPGRRRTTPYGRALPGKWRNDRPALSGPSRYTAARAGGEPEGAAVARGDHRPAARRGTGGPIWLCRRSRRGAAARPGGRGPGGRPMASPRPVRGCRGRHSSHWRLDHVDELAAAS